MYGKYSMNMFLKSYGNASLGARERRISSRIANHARARERKRGKEEGKGDANPSSRDAFRRIQIRPIGPTLRHTSASTIDPRSKCGEERRREEEGKGEGEAYVTLAKTHMVICLSSDIMLCKT